MQPTLILSQTTHPNIHYYNHDKYFSNVVAQYFLSFSVLIGYNHVLKISDFGASREWTENSTKMSFTGTVAWMAPEVIRNEPCSFKVDVW